MFTILAWVTLLGFVVYCTIADKKTDSVRDAWNVMILIAGFVWGSSQKKSAPDHTGTTTAEISGSITTETK